MNRVSMWPRISVFLYWRRYWLTWCFGRKSLLRINTGNTKTRKKWITTGISEPDCTLPLPRISIPWSTSSGSETIDIWSDAPLNSKQRRPWICYTWVIYLILNSDFMKIYKRKKVIQTNFDWKYPFPLSIKTQNKWKNLV